MNKKKKGMIAAICIALAALLLCGTVAAVWGIATAAKNGQLGGLVGELLAGQGTTSENPPSPDDSEQDPKLEQVTDNTHTEPTPDLLEPRPDDPPALYFFLGGCNTWIGESKIQEFCEPGKASAWDCRAVIEDYNVERVELWGWAAVFEEHPWQLGYQIDHEPPVYGENAEFYEPDPSSTTAALGMGAISAIGFRVSIPVLNLSGTHTVKILIRNQGGDSEGIITTLEVTKAECPYAPAFLADAAHLSNMLENQPSKGIKKFRYYPASDFDGDHVQITCEEDAMSTGFTVIPYTSEVYSTGARYLVIKLNYDTAGGYVIASSSTPENGTTHSFHFQQDDWWDLLIIDLAEIDGINQSYDVSYLYLCFYDNTSKSYPPITIPWIGTFQSIYAAQKYDEMHPYAKG